MSFLPSATPFPWAHASSTLTARRASLKISSDFTGEHWTVLIIFSVSKKMEYVSQYQELSEYSSSFAYGMMMMMKIIIIIITRPRPAFGRLGLGRSSGGKTSGVSLCLASRLRHSARPWSNIYWHFSVNHHHLNYMQKCNSFNLTYNEMPLSLWRGREADAVEGEDGRQGRDTQTHTSSLYIYHQLGRGKAK